jgi:type I restriction enzyme S subunit
LVSVTDGPFGSAFSSSDYSDEGAAVVRLGNIGFAEYRGTDQAYIPLPLWRTFRQHHVSRGDLLIAALGDDRNHAGRACVAPDLGPALVKGKCLRARVRPEMAVSEFLAFLLSSPVGADALGVASRGSTRVMINLDVLKSAVLPLPPVSAQKEILRATQCARTLTRDLLHELEAQIALLSEHRQALITAAVAGEIDIPGTAS